MAMDLQPLLLETLRSRSDASMNPALQALLSGANPAEAAGALPSTQELLDQIGSTNPTLGLIARYLTARRAAESEVVIEADGEAEDEHAEEEPRLAQVVQRVEQQVSKLHAELERLRERNDACAAALGACYLCWGEDPDCPVCHGAGRPGFALPDRQWLARLVAPALRRLQAQKEVYQPDSRHTPFNGFVQPVTIKKGAENE
jgi:hypothetical protein